MKNNSFKRVNIKIFIIPFIIITSIFFIVGIITINGIKEHYYRHMKDDSLTFAKSFSHSLSKAAEGKDVVNGLLEEKLLVASKSIALYDGEYSNELLKELAMVLEVDEIDYYNSSGELIYSNMEELIGWKAFEGHPVHDFMISDSVSYIDSIRQDSITGNYFKYSYFKVSDGFVQIGVMADKIYNFLGGFEIGQLLDEMKNVGAVRDIYYIDNNFNIIGSSGSDMTIDRDVKTAIIEDREYGLIDDYKAEKEYEVFVPVYLEDSKLGTLAIRQSLKDTESIIRKVSIIGIITLIIIYASLLLAMISTYKKNKKFIKLAYYDALTGLPNDEYLKEFLKEELEKDKGDKRAVLLINYKDFKIVNMTFGFEYGDEVLRKLGESLKELVDDNKKLFRFSGDRFVLYVKNYDDKYDLVSLISRIGNMFSDPIKVKDSEQNLCIQFGIVEIDNRYSNVDRVLKDASISLTNIKSDDFLNHVFFNEEMENKLQREEIIEKEIRGAIAENDDRIYLEYQPQVDLKTGKIIGLEALARMNTKSLGFVSPLEFIDVAERKQLIVPLGNLILKRACKFIGNIIDEGYKDVKVAVNVSGIQLFRDNFTDRVIDILKESGVKESNLELEITESVLLDNYEIINERLKTLREHNISVALDDFGTGYSSFSRLRELNIDVLKIDRQFIVKIPNNEYKELITGDIISMAHKLGLAVVAEGVEINKQKDYLIESDCDIMQGYLFSKPLSKENAMKLLEINGKE